MVWSLTLLPGVIVHGFIEIEVRIPYVVEDLMLLEAGPTLFERNGSEVSTVGERVEGPVRVSTVPHLVVAELVRHLGCKRTGNDVQEVGRLSVQSTRLYG